MRTKFRLWHSFLGLAVLVGVEWLLATGYAGVSPALVVLFSAIVGSMGMLYVATEVIEEVRRPREMLAFLSIVVAEFVLFFAFQYLFLNAALSQSFPALSSDPATLLLQSLMVFVFNPLYLPGDVFGRVLLFVNTASALGLVLFVLQNVWQIRRP